MRLLNRFKRDRRGVSAIEFAFIAPVLIVTYFSVAELCEAMLAERKVAHAASAVGDLVAQVSTIDGPGLTQVYAAASSILAPYSTTPMQIRVTSVTTDVNDNATVAWSCADNTTALGTGAAVTLPANLLGANQSVIMSEMVYTYNSPLNYLFKNAITFDQVFYLRPRLTSTIPPPTSCS